MSIFLTILITDTREREREMCEMRDERDERGRGWMMSKVKEVVVSGCA